MELYLPPKEKLKRNHGCFPKGHTPWNLGKRYHMPHNLTRFKKGNKPVNTKPVGTISDRNWHGKIYKFIKLADNIWIPYHKYLWMQKYGEVPKGSIVVFKNGDRNDFRMENIECITRNENMKRNTNHDKSRENLIKLWKREKIRYVADLPAVSGFGRLLMMREQLKMAK